MAVALLALAACNSGTPSPSAPSRAPTAPPQSAAPTTRSSPEDAAKAASVAAYLGMWRDFVAAAATADWQSPTLGRHATGTALSTLSRGLYADHYNGLISKGAPTHNAEVSSVDTQSNPTTVIVRDCSDSTNTTKLRSDGQPAGDSPGGHHLINATVQQQPDGAWRVTDFGVQEVGSC
ncbi:hypothetical protein [Allokutzneria sp. NRRL B-24872]|uniref:hypothetical protein n=1 Tax=Allokutzneria sp. NRRL B-24872 TaxID=1137961 RepID=UPI000A397725|nr:hypothetical protein [Allokutzneria sp. NRRL B-24872]